MTFSKIKTLFICNFIKSKNTDSYYDDWLDAFVAEKSFDIQIFNIQTDSFYQINIKSYDIIILSHSITANGVELKYSKSLKELLRKRRGKLLSFVGNELNLPFAHISEKINFLKTCEVDIIMSQLPIDAAKWLYNECSCIVLSVPHALNNKVFRPIIPVSKRPIDIGCRNAKYSVTLGDDERNRIIDFFRNHKFLGKEHKIDIETRNSKRFNRADWALFLNKCKGTISTEAGSYYLEKNDCTVKLIENYIKDKNKYANLKVVSSNSLLYKKIASILPLDIKEWLRNLLGKFGIYRIDDLLEEEDFEFVYDMFFRDKLQCRFYSKTISSRHFDAIGTKTCQIMFPGEFSGILKPDIHYIALNKDFSNIDEVIEKFFNDDYRLNMINNAYEFCIENHLYSHRINYILNQIDKICAV
jgi:hypothetical protein